MSRPPHPTWFNHPSNIKWRKQVMKFIIMQFSPRYVFLPFRSKYPPQHSVLKNPESMFNPGPRRSETLLKLHFYGEGLLAPCPNSKLEEQPMSAIRKWLFNIFAATLRIWGPTPIRNLRTRHAVVTSDPPNMDI
jgi:hypothetical protein